MTGEAKTLLIIGAITLVVLIGAVLMLGRSGSQTPSQAVDSKILVRDSSYKIASSSAKVTLVEFGDYQCPACAQAHPIVKEVLKEYSGRINFVFRNFPLPQHQNALISAEAAEAAGAQGKYWEMHDLLYENQNGWSESTQSLSAFTNYAQRIGLDTAKFLSDVTANKYSSRIEQDRSDGTSLGVNATPTFYINGKKITGVPTLADFRRDLDQELNH